MTAEEVQDKFAITEQLYRYCRSVDRLDVPLGHSVFHEDSTADFGGYKGTGRGWIDFICEEHRKFLHHSHQVTNVLIELDGDRAGSEAYVTASLQSREGDKIIHRQIFARYVDLWSRRNGNWAIDDRLCFTDLGTIGEATPYNTNPIATRDTSDPSYAVLGGVK